MKYTLSIEDKKKLKRLIQAKDDNIDVASVYNEFLTDDPAAIKKSVVDSFLQEGKTEQEAYFLSFCQAIDMDPDDEMLKIIEDRYHFDQMVKLDEKVYLTNPYFKNIHFPRGKKGRWELTEDYYAPYEGFIFQDTKTEGEYFREITSFGYFASSFLYLEILQDNKVWMSITPHEIETMQEAIDQTSGKVVAFGLGLGYFPYMVSLKDNVKEVWIVEKDPDVIQIFKCFILPQFSHKEKIKIIQEDAFKFAEGQMKKEAFDFAFVDIWHTPDDGLELYLKMKEKEKEIQGTVFSYWIEKSLLAMLRRALVTLIQEETEGSTDQDYLKADNFTDRLINKLHFSFKEKEVSSYAEISEMLSDEALRKATSILAF